MVYRTASSRRYTVLLVLGGLLPLTARAQSASGLGESSKSGSGQTGALTRPTDVKDPPKTWVDPDTGHRVRRLTDEPGSASLYFNVNAYSPDGREMIYTTPDGVSVLDLTTLATRSVVKGRAQVIMAGFKTPSVFYIRPEEHALYVTNFDTGETRKLGQVPPRGSISTINADETLAAGTFDEVDAEGQQYGSNGGGRRPAPATRDQQLHALDQPANKGEMMVRRLAARIPLVVFTMDLRNGTTKPLLHSTDWIGHMLFSPTDPTLLMYCHEGPWQAVDRIWTIRTDGSENRVMHQRTMQMEIAGHEFWDRGGKRIWYDLQTPKGQDFFLASVDIPTGERRWYHMERNEWSIHFNVNKDATLFTGDGGDPGQVAKAPDGEWIYLFRPELLKNVGLDDKSFVRPGVFHAEKLVNMSRHNYKLEPNVSFSPDGTMIIFRSNMFGPTYVFGVEIAKAR